MVNRSRYLGSGLVSAFFVLLLIFYALVGLGLSGVESVSRFGFFSVLVGVLILLVRFKGAPREVLLYAFSALYIASSWLWARDAAFGILGSYVTAVGGGFLLFGALRARWVRLDVAIFILLIPFAVNLYAFLVGDNLTGVLFDIEDEAAFKRFGGYVGHPSPLTTRLVAPLFVFALLGSYIQNRSAYFVLTGLVLFSAAFTIFATGSKKSLLLILPVLPLLMASLFSKLKKTSLFIRRSVSIGVFLALFAVVVELLASSSIVLSDLEVFSRFESLVLGGDDSTDERRFLLLLAPDLIIEAPFFGHGLDQFAVVTGLGFYSHNNFIELLVNTGFVGLLLYYCSISLAMVRIGRQVGGVLTNFTVVLVLLVLDFTGVTYGDRGSQIIVSAIFLRAFVFTKYGGGYGRQIIK